MLPISFSNNPIKKPQKKQTALCTTISFMIFISCGLLWGGDFGQLTYQGTCLFVCPLFFFFFLFSSGYFLDTFLFFSSQFLAKFHYWDIFSHSLHKGKWNNVPLHQLCWVRWWGYFRVVRQWIVYVGLGKGWCFYNWCRDYVQWCSPRIIRWKSMLVVKWSLF